MLIFTHYKFNFLKPDSGHYAAIREEEANILAREQVPVAFRIVQTNLKNRSNFVDFLIQQKLEQPFLPTY